MSTYRIFTIGQDQHFIGMPIFVVCADDKEAVDKAMGLANGLDQEMWDDKDGCAPPAQSAKDIDCVSQCQSGAMDRARIKHSELARE
jgi:hypothetical protein